MSKIDPSEARRIHRNYLSQPCEDQPRRVEAVIISIREAFMAKLGAVEGAQFDNIFTQLQFDTLVCYFGKYGAEDGEDKDGRNTVLVHLGNTSPSGTVSVVEGEIYNFGDLKPPKSINNEQVP
jgi:hypothetical protein